MTCPITNCIMVDPVIVIDCGHTFERKPIEEWVGKNKNCPLCKAPTDIKSLKPNFQLRQVITEYSLRKNNTN